MSDVIRAALEELRAKRRGLDEAIAALEGLVEVPAAPAKVALTPQQVREVRPAATPKVPAKPKPATATPKDTSRAAPGKYDSDVRDLLHLAGADGTRCADMARRIAGPTAKKDDVDKLVMAIWAVLQRFQRDGIAIKDGNVWKLKAVAA